MADAGSSGTKLFVGRKGGNMTDAKILSYCKKNVGNEKCEYQGVAALACDSDVTCNISDEEQQINLHTNITIEQLRIELPKALRAKIQAMQKTLGCDDQKTSVPIMATAGMRLLTGDEQAPIWDNICGVPTGESVGFMAKGLTETIDEALGATPMCGTISGTTEAYFEFVADWQQLSQQEQNANACRVSLTMGGASSQIALKLRPDQLTLWNEIDDVMAPYKNAKNSDKFFRQVVSTKYGTIILVSFLGTGRNIEKADGTFLTSQFAGGTNTLQVLADNLGALKNNYSASVEALTGWLNGDGTSSKPGDKWWQAVSTKLMPIIHNEAESVVFNTPALHDNNVLTQGEWDTFSQECNRPTTEQDKVKRIVLECVCTKNGSATFGYKGGNTCYKTWWTETYKDTLGKPCLKTGGTMKSDKADWATGVIHLLQNKGTR